MKIPSKIYDIAKWVCLTGLPAIIVFLNVILPICGVDAQIVQNISTIIAAFGTFVGSLIGVSSIAYAKWKEA